MNIREYDKNELICVVIQLWSSLSDTGNDEIFKEYLRNKGYGEEEVDRYVKGLDKVILKDR